jgi:hypothetical protein
VIAIPTLRVSAVVLARRLRRLGPALGRRRAGASRGAGRLTECRFCGADHVCPTDWEETDGTHWWIRLRCGACGMWREVVVCDEDAAVLDRTLGAQSDAIERAAARLDRERMVAQVEAFVAALERDLFDASSFARP